jgi:hypothetical protein
MSIIKSGTTNTTAYSVDANTNGDLVFIVSESLTAVTVSASANVGIGTSSPAEKLEVEFSANGYILADNSTDTNTGIKFANTGRTYGIFTDGGSGSSNSLRFYDFTASAERLRLDSAGNLGLGVTPDTTWNSSARVMQLGGFSSIFGYTNNVLRIANNAVFTAANETYGASSIGATYYQQYNGAHAWHTAASGTAGDPITFTQALSVGLGTSLALQGATSQTGTGITFPASQNASANANTLDDYEEGSFTPTAVCTGQTITYTVQSGSYTKIGNIVRVQISIVINTVSGAAGGNTTISGLPFSNGDVTYSGQAVIGYNDGFANTIYAAWITGTDMLFRSGTRSSGNDGGGFTAGGYIYINAVYRV